MINAKDAASALKEVSAAELQSRRAYSYSQSAPYCFVWGAAWLLGYGAEAIAPRPAAWVWLGWWWMALSIVGAALSILIGRMQVQKRGGSSWRIGILFLIIWLFTIAIFAVIHPKNAFEVGAYFPLLFAAIYAAIGLWMGLRYVLVGVFMALATLAAFFYLREYFFYWMALVGGGSLLLTGYWMRQA